MSSELAKKSTHDVIQAIVDSTPKPSQELTPDDLRDKILIDLLTQMSAEGGETPIFSEVDLRAVISGLGTFYQECGPKSAKFRAIDADFKSGKIDKKQADSAKAEVLFGKGKVPKENSLVNTQVLKSEHSVDRMTSIMNYMLQLPTSTPLLYVFFLSFAPTAIALPAGLAATGVIYGALDFTYRGINHRIQPAKEQARNTNNLGRYLTRMVLGLGLSTAISTYGIVALRAVFDGGVQTFAEQSQIEGGRARAIAAADAKIDASKKLNVGFLQASKTSQEAEQRLLSLQKQIEEVNQKIKDGDKSDTTERLRTNLQGQLQQVDPNSQFAGSSAQVQLQKSRDIIAGIEKSDPDIIKYKALSARAQKLSNDFELFDPGNDDILKLGVKDRAEFEKIKNWATQMGSDEKFHYADEYSKKNSNWIVITTSVFFAMEALSLILAYYHNQKSDVKLSKQKEFRLLLQNCFGHINKSISDLAILEARIATSKTTDFVKAAKVTSADIDSLFDDVPPTQSDCALGFFQDPIVGAWMSQQMRDRTGPFAFMGRVEGRLSDPSIVQNIREEAKDGKLGKSVSIDVSKAVDMMSELEYSVANILPLSDLLVSIKRLIAENNNTSNTPENSTANKDELGANSLFYNNLPLEADNLGNRANALKIPNLISLLKGLKQSPLQREIYHEFILFLQDMILVFQPLLSKSVASRNDQTLVEGSVLFKKAIRAYIKKIQSGESFEATIDGLLSPTDAEQLALMQGLPGVPLSTHQHIGIVDGHARDMKLTVDAINRLTPKLEEYNEVVTKAGMPNRVIKMAELMDLDYESALRLLVSRIKELK
jgi:hypothetical protein